MEKQIVWQQVQNILSENGVDVARLRADSELGSPEWHMDSVLFMKVFVELENQFGCEIDPEEALGETGTFGSLVAYLQQALEAG